MNAKTHNTAVVLIPPRERWEPIQAIRRVHDRQVRRWMPHVTLLYPSNPLSQFDALEEKLREACRRVDPFDVRLAEFCHFHHGRGRYTLWLAPEPRDAVVALQAALESAAPDCSDVSRRSSGFTPHLSIGQVRGHEAMASLSAELQASWQPLSFPAREVSMICRDDPPDDVFRVDRRIGLNS